LAFVCIFRQAATASRLLGDCRPELEALSKIEVLAADTPMETFLYHSTTVAVLAVLVVLLLGLRTMMKGTSPNLSQKLMRWRVGLQFVAILIIIAYVFVSH
jgi:hypothetical protein